MQNLYVAGLQYDITWADWTANQIKIERLLDGMTSAPDIILLPETFASGFTKSPASVAQTMDGDAVRWLATTASSRHMICMGSLVIKENARYYNRLVVTFPDGSMSYYDKRHLFSHAGEHEEFTAGTHRLVINCKGWRICPLVCYDLRFPVWSRNQGDYDLLIYVANWPAARADAWNSLLKARAIENQCVVFGLNRIGVDGNDLVYPGSSRIIDASGTILQQGANVEMVIESTLSIDELNDFRARYNFLPDRDSYIIT